MRNKFFIACVAVIIFILLLCTLVGCNATNESTDRIEQAINQSNNETIKDDNEQTVVNNYNGNYYDNSTTNNITNSYNTDDKDKEDDENVVKVYVSEGTIVNEDGEEEYREYNDNTVEKHTTKKNTITPIGNEKYDMDPDPNVVHIKNIKCPSCGAYSYIEHYNKADTNLQFYMGICNSCGYER